MNLSYYWLLTAPTDKNLHDERAVLRAGGLEGRLLVCVSICCNVFWFHVAFCRPYLWHERTHSFCFTYNFIHYITDIRMYIYIYMYFSYIERDKSCPPKTVKKKTQAKQTPSKLSIFQFFFVRQPCSWCLFPILLWHPGSQGGSGGVVCFIATLWVFQLMWHRFQQSVHLQ